MKKVLGFFNEQIPIKRLKKASFIHKYTYMY